MNLLILAFGLLLIGGGFVTLVRKVHDRTFHETLAVLRNAHGQTASAISAFVGVLVPIVSSIASGIAILVVALMGRSAAPMSWLGW